MSFIDSENYEELITTASMKRMAEVLENNGYEVTKTKLQITATHGGAWSTNGKISKITVIDQGDYRICRDIETSKGYLMSPNTGVLAALIQEAEFEEGDCIEDETGEIVAPRRNPYHQQAKNKVKKNNAKVWIACIAVPVVLLLFGLIYYYILTNVI